MNMFLPLLLLPLLISTAYAQIGDKADRPGVIQKAIVPKELIPASPALSAADELKTFRLAPGLRIELIASEPFVEDPVAAQFDQDGKLWVVEMRGYMPDLDGNAEDAPVGRVVVLQDTNGDGKMDKSTVFMDGLIMPRAIMPVGGGVLIGAPPHLYFCRDTNGDDKMDTKIEVASDYGVRVDPKRPELANPERAPNSPLWGLDNWIYNTAYMARFRYVNGEFRRDLTIFRGQWGLSQDDAGHLFYNSNSDQLRADIIPSQYSGRNPNLNRAVGVNVNAAENQLVWPARVTPGINRGYRPEMLRDGRLKEFTAANSPFILRSDLFSKEFYGNAFVAEPTGNLVRRNLLIETNGTLLGKNAYDKSEFLTSTDERFRPVNFTTGPDGALYIVDFYRGVLQHRISLTSYLRKQSEDRGLDKPIHLGRIWRVYPEGKKPENKALFSKETPTEWIKYLSYSNSWFRHTAQRLLVERNDLSVVPALKKIAATDSVPLGAVHALWTLEGLNQLDESTVTTALTNKNPQVRATGIRLSETFFNSEEKQEILEKVMKLAEDSASDVQLQLALTLGEAKDKKADLVMANLAKSDATNAFLIDAILSGLYGRELDLLEKLLADSSWNKPGKNSSRLLSGLAACIFSERRLERIDRMLGLITATITATKVHQKTLLDGILSTSPVTAKKPIKLKNEPGTLVLLQKNSSPEIKARVVKLTGLLTWPGKPGAKPEPVITPLTTEQKAQFELGQTLFTGSCAACHQTHGRGMDGLAPPLVDSEWVLGSEQKLVRIVLHGLHGPLKVNGRGYSLDMPSMGVFDDEQIAAILTYIRREWEHDGAPVKTESVKKIRTESAARQEAWTEAELLKIP